ncbi:MAG TPA: hypothetical protein VF070_00780, partial [Streptosporangiaceae bacterium]
MPEVRLLRLQPAIWATARHEERVRCQASGCLAAEDQPAGQHLADFVRRPAEDVDLRHAQAALDQARGGPAAIPPGHHTVEQQASANRAEETAADYRKRRSAIPFDSVNPELRAG